MAEDLKKEFKVTYDVENDILYLAKAGKETEFIEIAPGVNVELNASKEIIGFEIFEASRVLGSVVPSLNDRYLKKVS